MGRETWVVDNDVHGQLTPNIGITVRWVCIKHEGGFSIINGLCTSVGKLGLVGIVKIDNHIDALNTVSSVFGNDGDASSDHFLFILNDLIEIDRDDGVHLHKDRLAYAGCIEIERVVSCHVKGEVLRTNIEPERSGCAQGVIAI